MALLIGLIVGFAIDSPAKAAEKSFKISDWQTKIDIKSNGDFLVQEKQTVDFTGSFTFYTRSISHRRLDKISEISVFDNTAGRALVPEKDFEVNPGFTESSPATNVKIHFALSDVKQTWTIKYTVKGGLGFFEDHDEIYWNTIPSERTVPIEHLSVLVNLAKKEEQKNIRYTFFEDGVDRPTAKIVDEDTVGFEAGHAAPGTNFTVVVGWPPGAIERPGVVRVESKPDAADVFVGGQNTFLNTPVGLRTGAELTGAGPWQVQVQKYGVRSQPVTVLVKPGEVKGIELEVFDTFGKKFLVGIVVTVVAAYILLPLWLTIILFLRWRKTGRDPKGRGTIIAEFEPPDETIPSVVGTLYDERVDFKDLTAGIIDLAVRGYLEINELPKKHRFSKQDYEFVKKKDFTDSTLSEFEKKLLEDLFGTAKQKKLSALRLRFYSNLPKLQKLLYQVVVDKKYFTADPEKRRKKYRLTGSFLISFGLAGTFFYGLGLPLLISGVVVTIFARLAPQRTKAGVLAREKALGFKLYLNTAERFRIKKMTPETFERFLPYAMVFGIEKQWAAKFKDIYKDIRPDWYHGSTNQAFNSLMIASALSDWSSASRTAMGSRPGGGSSSSSGFGGFSSGSSGFSGGFSGGGGGGGGVSAG